MDKPMCISSEGEVILNVRQDDTDMQFSYRVELNCLRKTSAYFQRLLQGSNFREAIDIHTTLESLHEKHSSIQEAPIDALPTISIVDIGRISKVGSIKNLMGDFLHALHNQDLSTLEPPLSNLANLTIVADRFDALPHFSSYARRYLLKLDGRTKAKTNTIVSEDKIRQRVMIGILLDYQPWMAIWSKRLVLSGSTQWGEKSDNDVDSALWWDLPKGLEDELNYRHQMILQTIGSLQTYFLKLYASGQLQCKMGYDSSRQCDSFQLGEMVRFFLRAGTIQIQSTIVNDNSLGSENTDKRVEGILENLRQCSSYQIDQHHSHCGLRARLIPLIDLIYNYLNSDNSDVGICLECWQSRRSEYSWSESRGLLMWSPPQHGQQLFLNKRSNDLSKTICSPKRHSAIRDLFIADDRFWTK